MSPLLQEYQIYLQTILIHLLRLSLLSLDTKLYTLLYYCGRVKSRSFERSLLSTDFDALGKILLNIAIQLFKITRKYRNILCLRRIFNLFHVINRTTLRLKIFLIWVLLFFTICSSKKHAILYTLQFEWNEKTLYFCTWLSSANR